MTEGQKSWLLFTTYGMNQNWITFFAVWVGNNWRLKRTNFLFILTFFFCERRYIESQPQDPKEIDTPITDEITDFDSVDIFSPEFPPSNFLFMGVFPFLKKCLYLDCFCERHSTLPKGLSNRVSDSMRSLKWFARIFGRLAILCFSNFSGCNI